MNNLHDQFSRRMWFNRWSITEKQIRNQVSLHIRDKVRDQLGKQVESQVETPVDYQLKKELS